MRDKFILSNKANGALINSPSFAPKLTRSPNATKIKFGNGYVIPMFYLQEDGEDLKFDQAIEPDNANKELDVSDQETEFYLCIKVKPLSNQIQEVKFKSNKEIKEDKEDEEYDTYLNIRLPIVKLEKINGSFEIVKIYLNKDVIWDKKPVEIPLRTQLISKGTCLTAYGYLDITGKQKYYLTEDASDKKTEEVDGKFFGVKIIGSGNDRRLNIGSVEWGAFSLAEIQDEEYFSLTESELDFLDGNEPSLQPLSVVFPIAYIKDGTATQLLLGNLEATYTFIRQDDGGLVYKILVREL